MPTIDLPIAPVDYRVFGPDAGGAPVAVFVHGFLVNGSLWDPVAERPAREDSGLLRDGLRRPRPQLVGLHDAVPPLLGRAGS